MVKLSGPRPTPACKRSAALDSEGLGGPPCEAREGDAIARMAAHGLTPTLHYTHSDLLLVVRAAARARIVADV
eukprot:6242263-Alexandrium_andersonii.AAC.1